MTAADDGLRAALAEAMVQHQHHRCSWSGCGDLCYFEELAAALLPVAREIADQRAAEELESWARTFRVCGQAGLRRDSRRVFPQVADVLEAGASDLRAADLAGDQP